MSISFAEFILRYLDNWNIEAGCLADDLNVSFHTLNKWLYGGQIPNPENIGIIKNYFEEDFKGVVFDGRKFKRNFKVIRPDGSSQTYPTLQRISWDEGVDYSAIVRCLLEDDVVRRGDREGYRFQRVYVEIE